MSTGKEAEGDAVLTHARVADAMSTDADAEKQTVQPQARTSERRPEPQNAGPCGARSPVRVR